VDLAGVTFTKQVDCLFGSLFYDAFFSKYTIQYSVDDRVTGE
jgi:hypothetical protein